MMLGAVDRLDPCSGITTRESQDWLYARRHKDPYFRHAGIDIFGRTGFATPIYAPENGRVYSTADEATTKQKGHWGGYSPGGVAIQGESGFFHWMGHLSAVGVQVGQQVVKGQALAVMTKTWTYPEIHWEVRRKPYCLYSKTKMFDGFVERYPWVISVDPVRWLGGYILTPKMALAGLKDRENIPVAKLRGNYPITFTAKDSRMHDPEEDPFLQRETRKAAEAKGAGWGLAVGIAAGAAGLYWWSKRKNKKMPRVPWLGF